MNKKLSFSGKISRLRSRLRDSEWRQYGALLLAGKLTGIGLLILMTAFLNPGLLGMKAFAADPVLKGNDIVNPINTVWTLLAAFLVFGMQVGFTMLEAGFCRSRETVNVLMECIVDTCLCGILFYAFGFSFMFSHGNGLIGYNWFFLNGVPATYEGTGVAFLAFWLFQFAFADTCSTITSGAMIGRTGFVGDLIYSFFVSGFIYPIIGHWAWGPDGFLAMMGSAGNYLPWVGTSFHDFAGSTVVHTIGGFIALAGAIVLGPRLGRKFKRDGGGAMLPHDLTIAASGGLILWFGWYGFNPGSTLSAMDFEGIGRVAANTTLAACSAGLLAMAVAYSKSKTWDVGFTVNGFLAGLVAITCPCCLRQVWVYRSLYGRQRRPAEGTLLWRRHASADSPGHRQRHYHHRHICQRLRCDVCRQRDGSPACIGGRRSSRFGFARARDFGLSGVRHLVDAQPGQHGRQGNGQTRHRDQVEHGGSPGAVIAKGKRHEKN